MFSLRNKYLFRGLFDLHPQKIGQLTYHTHLKFLFHFFSKLMCLRISGCFKDDIIHIDLSTEFVIPLISDEEILICLSSCESFFQKISGQSLIPRPWSLLEPIQGFLQLVGMLRIVRIKKSFRLLHINFFLKNTIQKGTLNIHLVKLEAKMTRYRESRILMDSRRAAGAKVLSKSTPSI